MDVQKIVPAEAFLKYQCDMASSGTIRLHGSRGLPAKMHFRWFFLRESSDTLNHGGDLRCRAGCGGEGAMYWGGVRRASNTDQSEVISCEAGLCMGPKTASCHQSLVKPSHEGPPAHCSRPTRPVYTHAKSPSFASPFRINAPFDIK